jgi:hypothetical protein
MSNGLPTRAKVGIPGKEVAISPATYFLAKRMEMVGMLRPGSAFQLATVSQDTYDRSVLKPKRGKK